MLLHIRKHKQFAMGDWILYAMICEQYQSHWDEIPKPRPRAAVLLICLTRGRGGVCTVGSSRMSSSFLRTEGARVSSLRCLP